jgi:diaminopimelate epimerase
VTAELRLTKYEASGNDFLLVDELDSPAGQLDVPALCDRWTGVGADGLIRIGRGEGAAYRFDLTNADGSAAAMSGNGMRCLGAFVCDTGHAGRGTPIEVETRAGVRTVTCGQTDAVVGMGEPNFTKAAIPMRGPAWETFQRQPFDVHGVTFTATALSMGNSHLVLFLDEDPERFHVEHMGPMLEAHELFPERTNVEFARIADDGTADVRVWERGVGETLACGTGACAVAVAANEAGLAPRTTTIRFRGGPLEVERRDDGQVLLGGPVTKVFDAVVDLDRLAAVGP